MARLAHYTLTETLHADAGAVLYRGVRQQDGLPVIIKTLRTESPAPRDVERLRREYEVGRQLDSLYALKPLALEAQGARLFLIAEDPGGEPLFRLLGPPMESGQFLDIALQLTAALADLHGQGLVHQDLKPANILIHPQTGKVKLIDFGAASRITRAPNTVILHPGWIEGSLAYMSPEQTGRMNRVADHRSDLYSLGVIFYEMLTGRLPFQATDPVEWVHCHIAREPQSPHGVTPSVPELLAHIVLKLLAKQAEERYQSAHGLRFDLERCRRQWESHGQIEPFPLGQQDIPDLFLIPQKLYGRVGEIELLLRAFERVVATGRLEVTLVCGYSGVGKSSLVRELYKPIVRERGFFISGKFDEQQRDIPYAPLAQAFRELVQQILTQSEDRIRVWKEELQQALGVNGQLIIDVIPQVELIIGPQPPAPELPLSQAQHRFQLVFHKFIGIFAKKEHPLVLFLDDLQWLDLASLTLVKHVVTHPETRYLFLIGAYRDNEVSASHPLVLTLDEIRKNNTMVQEIVLGPLSLAHLEQLATDTVHRSISDIAPLAQLVYDKTAGNPFFARQFLTTLHQDGLLTYDERNRSWQWDLVKIHQQGFTDNVVELMVGKLKRFAAATQKVLQLAACIGNTAEIRILAVIGDCSEDQIHMDLWPAVNEGLLVRIDDTYNFLHDRVREAAYALIPEEQRTALHLRIGRLLLSCLSAQEIEAQVFDITNQLNLGAALITEPEEQTRVAELNLRAGRKAKGSTAYRAAASYFSMGAQLLDTDAWERQYQLAYPLFLEQAECEFLSGTFTAAERLFPMLLRQARTRVEKAAVHRVKIDLHTTKGENSNAIESALEGLRLFGVDISPQPSADEVQTAYQAVWRNLGARRIEDLIKLPLITDPELQAVMDILASLSTPAFQTDPNLFSLCVSHGVNLCLQHGNTAASAPAYGVFGLTLAYRFHRYQDGYRFAKLAFDLMERHQLLAYKAKVNSYMRVSFWTQPLDKVLEHMQAAFAAAVETGDVPVACLSCNLIVVDMLLRGDHLSEIHRAAERGRDFVQRAGFRDVRDMLVSLDRFVQTMRGRTRSFSTYDAAAFSEAEFESTLTEDRMQTLRSYYYAEKLMARFMSGDYEAALAAGEKTRALLSAFLSSHGQDYFFHFYHALTLAAVFDRLPPEQQQEAFAALVDHREQLRRWAESYPPTFDPSYTLVSAEIARLTDKELEAERLYEQAIQSAREHRFVQNEGLGNELAARFYWARSLPKIADLYLREARACYERWGAEGKVRQLNQRYPQLVEPRPLAPTVTFAGRPEQLDLLSVVKASQSISREILLPQLQETLMRMVLEQAGAQRGMLLLAEREDLAIHARAEVKDRETRVEVVSGTPVSEELLPVSILRYVKRTGEAVVLDDAAVEGPYIGDEYLARHQPRSVLCLPIIRQAQIVGLLYLENNLLAGAFTQDTLAVLELLAAQAAISLETARLYTDLRQENAARQRAEEELRQAEEKYRSIFENAVEGIFQSTPGGGRFLSANPAVARMLGYASIEELLAAITDMSQQLYVEPAHRTEYQRQLAEHGAVQGFETQSRRKDGSIMWISLNARTVRDAHGSLLYYEGTIEDITARKQAEAEREALIAELAARNAELERFAYTVSHDLKSPLITIRGFLGFVEKAALVGDLDQMRADMARIVNATDKMQQLLEELLQFSRLGRSLNPSTAVPLRELAGEAVTMIAGRLIERRVQVTIAPDLPVVYGDRVRLREVLENLLDNAVKFMGDQSQPQVDIGARRDGAELVFYVRDNGMGIEPRYHEKVFGLFDKLEPQSEGSGAGLAIVKRIVEGHGGRIWVESAGAGHGSTFCFTLPRTRTNETQ